VIGDQQIVPEPGGLDRRWLTTTKPLGLRHPIRPLQSETFIFNRPGSPLRHLDFSPRVPTGKLSRVHRTEASSSPARAAFFLFFFLGTWAGFPELTPVHSQNHRAMVRYPRKPVDRLKYRGSSSLIGAWDGTAWVALCFRGGSSGDRVVWFFSSFSSDSDSI